MFYFYHMILYLSMVSEVAKKLVIIEIVLNTIFGVLSFARIR